MVEQEIMEMVKEDMLKIVEKINLENADDTRFILEKQLLIIESLKAMNEKKVELSKQTSNASIDALEEPDTNSESSAETESHENGYRFVRNLKGGHVPDIDSYVPERVVRELNLETGDRVFAERLDKGNPGSRYFKYEMAEKLKENEDTDRIQISYCPVKKEAGSFMVDMSAETGEYIRFNESLYTVVLKEEDIFQFRIAEGDLIDIAYPADNIEKAKVIWKHPLPEERLSDVDNKSLEKPSLKSNKANLQKVAIKQTLVGKTILVIGNEPKRTEYKKQIEKRGGNFLWADASDHIQQLKSRVKNADKVIFLLSLSGHVGMKHIKEMCKEHDVEFIPTWSNGTTSLVRLSEEA